MWDREPADSEKWLDEKDSARKARGLDLRKAPKEGTVDVKRVTGTKGWKGKSTPELMSL